MNSKLGGDVLVLKFGEQVTFSGRDSPDDFWNGESNKYSVYLKPDNEGEKDGKKFKLLTCSGSERTAPCDDW